MTVVALEEHYATEEVLAAWQAADPASADPSDPAVGDIRRRLLDLGDERLAAMDDGGIDLAVLSLSTPGVQDLAPADAVGLARGANDRLADAVRAHPDRYGGFAALPTPSPGEAALELERAVRELGFSGAMLFPRTGGRPIDHAEFWPILEAADALRAPLYLHPQTPPPAVREAYYGGFDPVVSETFARYGLGWHYEVGIGVLRLVLAGVFDRFPHLQVIVGHWGEVVLFYLDRIAVMDRVAHLERPIIEYMRSNVFVTGSGVASHRAMRWATEVVGIDRVMFSSDYPFVPSPAGGAPGFLADAGLSDADRQAVASGTWEAVRAGIRV